MVSIFISGFESKYSSNINDSNFLYKKAQPVGGKITPGYCCDREELTQVEKTPRTLALLPYENQARPFHLSLAVGQGFFYPRPEIRSRTQDLRGST